MRFVFLSFYKITNLVNFINPCRNMFKAMHESVVSLFADFFIHLFGSLGPFSGILKLFWCFLESLSDTIQPWKENFTLSHHWKKNNVQTFYQYKCSTFINTSFNFPSLFCTTVCPCVYYNKSFKQNQWYFHGIFSSMHFHLYWMQTHFSIAFMLGALIRLRLEFMSLSAFVMISVCFLTSSGVSSYKIH